MAYPQSRYELAAKDAAQHSYRQEEVIGRADPADPMLMIRRHEQFTRLKNYIERGDLAPK